eukprot:201277_1
MSNLQRSSLNIQNNPFWPRNARAAFRNDPQADRDTNPPNPPNPNPNQHVQPIPSNPNANVPSVPVPPVPVPPVTVPHNIPPQLNQENQENQQPQLIESRLIIKLLNGRSVKERTLQIKKFGCVAHPFNIKATLSQLLTSYSILSDVSNFRFGYCDSDKGPFNAVCNYDVLHDAVLEDIHHFELRQFQETQSALPCTAPQTPSKTQNKMIYQERNQGMDRGENILRQKLNKDAYKKLKKNRKLFTKYKYNIGVEGQSFADLEEDILDEIDDMANNNSNSNDNNPLDRLCRLMEMNMMQNLARAPQQPQPPQPPQPQQPMYYPAPGPPPGPHQYVAHPAQPFPAQAPQYYPYSAQPAPQQYASFGASFGPSASIQFPAQIAPATQQLPPPKQDVPTHTSKPMIAQPPSAYAPTHAASGGVSNKRDSPYPVGTLPNVETHNK